MSGPLDTSPAAHNGGAVMRASRAGMLHGVYCHMSKVSRLSIKSKNSPGNKCAKCIWALVTQTAALRRRRSLADDMRVPEPRDTHHLRGIDVPLRLPTWQVLCNNLRSAVSTAVWVGAAHAAVIFPCCT